jgi:hypothetical protein
MLVEIKCINVRRNTAVFQIVEEINMFRPFSGWVIIRLRQSQPDNGPPRKGPKHVVDFFNNLKHSCVVTDIYTLNFY